MPAERFIEALNDQVSNEFAASHQYVAVAAFYEAQTLPQLASFFYEQALEERGHAMMMVQFLLDTGAEVTTPGVAAPSSRFADAVEPIALALAQEQRVSEQINALAATARDAGDYSSEQFMQWFIKEQVEEVATMGGLLRVAERAGEDAETIEEYLAREHPGGEGTDPTAPQPAGTE